jgi:hypothetical protein
MLGRRFELTTLIPASKGLFTSLQNLQYLFLVPLVNSKTSKVLFWKPKKCDGGKKDYKCLEEQKLSVLHFKGYWKNLKNLWIKFDRKKIQFGRQLKSFSVFSRGLAFPWSGVPNNWKMLIRFKVINKICLLEPCHQ